MSFKDIRYVITIKIQYKSYKKTNYLNTFFLCFLGGKMKKKYFLIIMFGITLIFVNTSLVEAKPSYAIIDVAIENSNVFVPWRDSDEYYDALAESTNQDEGYGYTWVVGDHEYRFNLSYTYLEDIMDGSINDYDVYAYIGGHDIEYFCWLPRYYYERSGISDDYTYEQFNNLKNKLENFIKNGGGWVGHCSGAIFPLDIEDDAPRTIGEWQLHKNAFLNDDFDIKLHRGNVKNAVLAAFPIVDQYFKTIRIKQKHIPWPCFQHDPARNANSVYCWFSSHDTDNPIHEFGGPCIDLEITNKDHPIFNGYSGDTLRFYSVGGGPFYIPLEYSDFELAKFPKECYGSDETTQVIAWNFPLKDLFNVKTFGKSVKNLLNLIFKGPYLGYVNFIDWDKTSDIIELGFENLPAAVALNYPDDDGGRVIMTTLHPELKVWDGGHIKNAGESDDNCMYDGLYAWYDENGLMDDPDIKYQPNNWYSRREAAWASGIVPDEHLPPVYGQSQVVLNSQILQEDTDLTIDCCVGLPYDNNCDVNLSLYYKYNKSAEGTNFTNWTLYDSIYETPYKFIFNAANAERNGTYRFCSILNYSYETGNPPETIYYQEEFPPDPDTKIFVGDKIIANFNCSSAILYDINNITFYDKSYVYPGTHITNYSWDLGDCNISYEQNVTHKYGDNGVYVVWHNITNNVSETSSISKNITVHNVPPEADFLPTSIVIKVGETVNFIENATDMDGSIVECYWDFGDNTTTSGFNVNHTYNKNGFFTVSLNVTDDDGITDTKNISVCNDRKEYSNCVLVVDGIVNGNLNNDDPENLTWTTIQKAVDNLSTSDYLYINSSYYNEDVVINKSLTIIGEDENTVIINGSLTLIDPFDYELPDNGHYDWIHNVSMYGNKLLYHLNNDSNLGENYSSSTTVYDSSGQGNNGTINGCLWSTATLKGAGALYFDGTNDSINLSSISALTGENVTISAWINWQGGSGAIDTILSQSNNTHGYCLYINNTNNTPSFRLNNTTAAASMNLTNGWHHIVGTHNNTSSNLSIFVDGRLSGTVEKAGSGIDTKAFVGFDNISNYYYGTIDEVSVWNRTLSDDEINRMYNRNYGIIIDMVTLQNSNKTGLTICNNSFINNCILVNHTFGLSINNLCNIIIQCNISECDTGISITDSNPDEYEENRVIASYLNNNTEGIIIDNCSYINIEHTSIYNTNTPLDITNSNFNTIDIIETFSTGNSSPDTPTISGPSQGDINTSYNFYSCTNDSDGDILFYLFYWGDGNFSTWTGPHTSGLSNYKSYSFSEQGGYYVKVKAKDIFYNETNWSEPILFRTENLTPLINSVVDTPDPVGFGFNVNITTNVTDDMSGNYSGIKTVKVNITYPDDTFVNVSMTDIGNDTYQYDFTDTWTVGQYDYSIWAIDNAYNTNTSSGHSFNVSVDATISICTINNSYTDNCTVNLTDPPSSSYQVGYELIDDGDVLHIWNNLDNYYFNTSSGIQLTNHYDEYWSHNVLMLGYYNNDEWNLIYRTDELSGFNKEIISDNETYVNATLWKNLNYAGYDFRLAIRYHLGINDNELTVIPYIKNIDNEDIPYNLGFAWEIKDIQIDMTEENDYIDINGTSYYLNASGLNETYTNLDVPSFYIKEDTGVDESESLYLRWNENLNYKVQVKSRTGQYNAPVTLGIKIGTLDVGQEKQTEIFWHDACEVTYYFNDHDMYNCWTTNPLYMVDGSTSNYASTAINFDVENLISNTCSGSELGAISKVEIRAFGKYSGTGMPPIHDINLLTLGAMHIFSPSTTGAWSSWYDITNNIDAPNPWTWDDVKILEVNVEAAIGGLFTMYCSKVEVRVTYNANPVISNPVPSDGSNGALITSVLNITVNDADGDTMNITWLSNSSGSWQIFGRNNSVGNGTYHQIFSNATVNGQWWYWKVNVSDGSNHKYSDVYSFYTGYQSKIENTGSTNFTGYLLMQIEFYNTTNSTWILDQEVVNETTTRTINTGSTLALDTIFNPHNVSTSSFTNGNGTYRVYAAFRDPDGDVLICDDESLLEANYQFTVSTS